MKLVIDLPPREEQIAFNRKRWEQLGADPELAKWPGKVETNVYGNILVNPPPSGIHSSRQGEITFLLRSILGGYALPECPVSTIDGVRAADVGWYSAERFSKVKGQVVFETAPEICVEILSPSNTPLEMRQKRSLYFEAGAQEVWLCECDGTLRFFTDVCATDPESASIICPTFPSRVPL